MRKLILLSLVILSFVFFSCEKFKKTKTESKIVAEVGNKKLFQNQLRIIVPKNSKKEDSVLFAKNYIEKWIKDQLLLEKAELYLDQERLDEIGVMIENYKTSLMVFQYQQLFIQQKLDTIVAEKAIEEYYDTHSSNFILDSAVVKVIFVKLLKSVPDKHKVKRWMLSHQEKDLIKIEDYCYQNAKKFSMGEEWIYFNHLLTVVPKKIDNKAWFLRNNKFIETQDSLYTYYVQIIDYKLGGENKPVSFVKNQIKSIILNHRKIKLINNLEKNIYNDAINQKKITIYKN